MLPAKLYTKHELCFMLHKSVDLDDGRVGEVTNIHILSVELRGSTWDRCLSKSPAFEFVDELVITGAYVG